MLIMIDTVPSVQDRRVAIACIRACVWATIEGWPFCVLN